MSRYSCNCKRWGRAAYPAACSLRVYQYLLKTLSSYFHISHCKHVDMFCCYKLVSRILVLHPVHANRIQPKQLLYTSPPVCYGEQIFLFLQFFIQGSTHDYIQADTNISVFKERYLLWFSAVITYINKRATHPGSHCVNYRGWSSLVSAWASDVTSAHLRRAAAHISDVLMEVPAE